MIFRLAQAAIDDYTVRAWDAAQADRYLAMLWETFESIAADPVRWRRRPELHPDCRVCLAGRHAILFRMKNDQKEIARVLHDAMDFKRHVERLFEDS